MEFPYGTGRVVSVDTGNQRNLLPESNFLAELANWVYWFANSVDSADFRLKLSKDREDVKSIQKNDPLDGSLTGKRSEFPYEHYVRHFEFQIFRLKSFQVKQLWSSRNYPLDHCTLYCTVNSADPKWKSKNIILNFQYNNLEWL